MKGFKWKDMGRTRGGRVSQRGFLLLWAGFAGIFIGGLAAGAAHAPGPVVVAVLVVTFAMAFVGLGITVVGQRIDKRALSEYNRKVEAGELPPWKPGDPNPLA
jgi:hypothetical protein